MIIFKNLFSFALTFKGFDWLVMTRTQAAPIFNALGAVQAVICLTSIPLCKSSPVLLLIDERLQSLMLTLWFLDIYGKRLRSFFHRYDLLAMFKVR
jgi:hypothetical protein